MEEQKIPTVGGIVATAIPTATATVTPTEMTRYRKLWLAPATEPKTALIVTFVPFVRMQQLIVGNWIRTKAKDLIIGQVFSNETRRGQVSIKSQG